MRFIGCKEKLLPFIDYIITQKEIKGETFCDLFAGTASVGKLFKKKGFRIISNDFLYFSYVLQYAYIKVNEYPKFEKLLDYLKIKVERDNLFADNRQPLREVIRYLNNLEGREGFIYKNYSYEGTKKNKIVRKFFIGENAKKIDAVRQTIEDWWQNNLLTKDEYFVLLASIIEAVPYVSNISGTYAAFLKNWDKRAFKPFTLEPPVLIESKKNHRVYNVDSFDLIKKIKSDILYLDPPYNTREYVPNYHILETIARWDNPKIEGVAGLRPYENQKSRFCSKAEVYNALNEIVANAKFRYLILSYNEEGLLSEKQIFNILKQRGKVEIFDKEYRRFKSSSRGLGLTNVHEKFYLVKEINSKNVLNDLSGSEWLYFLNSIEETNYPVTGPESFAHHIRRIHPSPKPPQLMKKIIEFFTKEGGRVLDPFVGVGGTLLACSLSKREGVGIDLSEKYIELYKHATKELGLKIQKTYVGDSRNIQKILGNEPEGSFDLILTDPPYSEMLSRKRTGERSKKNYGEPTPFTSSELDLGNLDRESFLNTLKEIIEKSLYYLKPKGYLIIFAKDLQPTKKSPNLLHAEVVNTLSTIDNLRFRGYKIWYDKTQKLYPFGYPHAFVANQFHQYILIFRKEK